MRGKQKNLNGGVQDTPTSSNAGSENGNDTPDENEPYPNEEEEIVVVERADDEVDVVVMESGGSGGGGDSGEDLLLEPLDELNEGSQVPSVVCLSHRTKPDE